MQHTPTPPTKELTIEQTPHSPPHSPILGVITVVAHALCAPVILFYLFIYTYVIDVNFITASRSNLATEISVSTIYVALLVSVLIIALDLLYILVTKPIGTRKVLSITSIIGTSLFVLLSFSIVILTSVFSHNHS